MADDYSFEYKSPWDKYNKNPYSMENYVKIPDIREDETKGYDYKFDKEQLDDYINSKNNLLFLFVTELYKSSRCKRH